jgi:hypothetical protein
MSLCFLLPQQMSANKLILQSNSEDGIVFFLMIKSSISGDLEDIEILLLRILQLFATMYVKKQKFLINITTTHPINYRYLAKV